MLKFKFKFKFKFIFFLKIKNNKRFDLAENPIILKEILEEQSLMSKFYHKV